VRLNFYESKGRGNYAATGRLLALITGYALVRLVQRFGARTGDDLANAARIVWRQYVIWFASMARTESRRSATGHLPPAGECHSAMVPSSPSAVTMNGTRCDINPEKKSVELGDHDRCFQLASSAEGRSELRTLV
jgi:hypothetical protein